MDKRAVQTFICLLDGEFALCEIHEGPPTFQAEFVDFLRQKQFEAVALGKSAQDEQVFRRAHRGCFAQAERSSRRTFRCRPVQLPEELHLHGAMEPQLRKLGMPTRLENDTIDLLEEFNVCKTGDQLSADQARILKQFGQRLAQFCVRLLAR
ncbi:hypothetical protein niasHT_004325 [Heterodera trifolii]|uniref:Large ribosomal subunit protein uL10-like insertion domain-containing protein n=1 Tax=Heterodera trifolii TaxID=157864 RepID=A0ABD2LR02_9BILA